MSKNRKPKLSRSKEEWAILIKEFHASGLTRKEFCNKNNLSSEYFYKLVRDSLKEVSQPKHSLESKASFVPIKFSSSSTFDKLTSNIQNQTGLANIKSSIKINFANGISVEFANGCSGLKLNIIKDWLYANK